MKKIIPAILSKNLNEVKKKINLVKELTDWVQIDVCDNKFVPSLTIEVKELKGLNKEINLEIHLMTKNPTDLFNDCKNIGAKRVIVHIEAVDDIEYVLHKASQYDFEFGIAINPKTPVSLIQSFINKIDLVLLLSVEPGFSGQKFLINVLNKVKEIKTLNSEVKIAIDGGVNHDSIQDANKAGVNIFVIGSTLFDADNVEENYNRLLERLKL